jgi:hypothetical protein
LRNSRGVFQSLLFRHGVLPIIYIDLEQWHGPEFDDQKSIPSINKLAAAAMAKSVRHTTAIQANCHALRAGRRLTGLNRTNGFVT